MKRTMRWVGAGLAFSLGLGVVGMQAQQPVSAEPQAPSGTVQAPREVVPPLPVPRLVKFAGTLRDELGKPRTGVVGVTFAVYKEQEGGAALWLETQNVELDEQGRYTILLGSNKSEGLPLELFTAGEPRWLGVQVQMPGEVEQPRVLLVSVPYALKAADAETLGGLPASAFALAAPSGTVPGVSVPGTTTQTGANSKTVAKAATSRTTKGAAAATPIAANFIPVFTDSLGTLGSSAMLQSGSNIGIGTTTPGATLDVNGGARALSYLFSGNAAVPTDATATIFNQANVGPTFSGLSFSVRTGLTPANALSVDPSQNVNIAGNAAALAYKFTGNAALPTDATATILNAANVGPVFSGLSFRVRTGSPPADALTVASNQNVGIGTSAPASKLHVFVPGSSNPISALTIDVQTFGTLANAQASHFLRVRDLGTVLGTLFIIRGDGHVGIGTSTPGHKLEIIDTGNSGLRVETDTTGGTVASFGGFGDFQIDAPNVPGGRFVVTQGGNVGIGTTTPAATLDVAGNGNGTAALLNNTASGNIVLGQAAGVNKFRVDGNGSIITLGNAYLATAGNGVILKSPDGSICVLLGINNTGAPTFNAVPCPAGP